MAPSGGHIPERNIGQEAGRSFPQIARPQALYFPHDYGASIGNVKA
jgi:hypothetical protein